MAEKQLRADHGTNYFHLVRHYSYVAALAELVQARKTDYELRSSPFWLANFAVYEPNGDGTGASVTLCNDGTHNPFQKLKHPSELEAVLRDGELPLSPELSRVLAGWGSNRMIRVRYADLSTPDGAQLRAGADGTARLEMDLRELARFQEGRPYFNASQRAFLTNLYGAPDDQGHMVGYQQQSTAVVLPSRSYVEKQPRPFVRGSWTNTVQAGSIVELCENFKENVGCILGVRH